MNIKAAILATVFSLTIIASLPATELALEFGREPGKVGYLNQNTNPGEEVYEIGPRSFRVIDKAIWVLDTVGNKLIKLDLSGNLQKEISFGKPDEKILAEDFVALSSADGQISGFWVINGFRSTIFRLTKDGSLVDELASDELLQPMRIEIDNKNNLYVSDDGEQKIFVFSAAKQLIAQIDYEWSGLFPAAETGLFCLKYNAKERRSELVKLDITGKETNRKPLAFEKHYNSHLWWVDEEKQEAFVSYVAAETKERRVTLARVGLDGSVKGMTDLQTPRNMTRFIDCNKGEAWLGDADYTLAPAGKLKFIKVVLP